MAARMLARTAAGLAVLLVTAAAVVAGSAAPALAARGVGMTATVNRQTLDHRVRLDPGAPADVAVTVTNNTDTVLRVRSVRLSGTVLGLTFYSAGTVLHLTIPARQSRSWTVEVDLADLGSQATGLLPLDVALVGEDRSELVTLSGTADLRGSLWCAYGIFGLGLLVATIVAWVTALLALARGRLPRNRWWRAVRFVWGGFGVGLVAVVTLSVLRVIAPSAPVELAFVLGAGLVAFVLGYLSPRPASVRPPEFDHPGDRFEQDDRFERDDRTEPAEARYPDSESTTVTGPPAGPYEQPRGYGGWYGDENYEPYPPGEVPR